ncbi:MAG: hypothetical protein MJ070_10405 [Lachnospiraceae bacterium]|nr:hypothetical protein [Lachnospiraceae bacterium]
MNKKQFHIGAYLLQKNARTEAHVRDIAECGLDFIACLNLERNGRGTGFDTGVLDLFSRYGLGCIVSGVLPGWWGGNGERAGQLCDTNPLSAYEAAAASFTDHPAIWGIDLGDEPSALDFPYYGKIAETVKKCFPNQFCYLNLYPNYASVASNTVLQTRSQLGTETYEEYIEAFVKDVPTDCICYDFYLYSLHDLPRMYDNFRIVSDACRRTGRSFWYVPQVNSDRKEETTSVNRLRFQAFTAMAYGAVCLIWACWCGGWWYHNVLDGEGNRTEQYGKLKTVNADIRRIADEYMKYRSISTHLIGFDTDDSMGRYSDVLLPSLSVGSFSGVRGENGEKLAVGYMKAKDGKGEALMIAASDDPYDENKREVIVVLRCGCTDLRAFGTDGGNPLTKEADGSYRLRLRSCGGALVTAEP